MIRNYEFVAIESGECVIPCARNHNPLFIINRSWILTIHKGKILWKKLLRSQWLMWIRKRCISLLSTITLTSGLSQTLMRPTSKDSHWKTAFKNAGLCTENCGESRPIFVNVNMYVFKSCAAISGEFLKSSEMAAHNSNAYIWIFFPCFWTRKYQKW